MVCLQPEHELHNADELLTLLLRHPQGMLAGQIKDAYKGILDDVKAGLFGCCCLCVQQTWCFRLHAVLRLASYISKVAALHLFIAYAIAVLVGFVLVQFVPWAQPSLSRQHSMKCVTPKVMPGSW